MVNQRCVMTNFTAEQHAGHRRRMWGLNRQGFLGDFRAGALRLGSITNPPDGDARHLLYKNFVEPKPAWNIKPDSHHQEIPL
jgi:hypothetical protein